MIIGDQFTQSKYHYKLGNYLPINSVLNHQSVQQQPDGTFC